MTSWSSFFCLGAPLPPQPRWPGSWESEWLLRFLVLFFIYLIYIFIFHFFMCVSEPNVSHWSPEEEVRCLGTGFIGTCRPHDAGNLHINVGKQRCSTSICTNLSWDLGFDKVSRQNPWSKEHSQNPDLIFKFKAPWEMAQGQILDEAGAWLLWWQIRCPN